MNKQKIFICIALTFTFSVIIGLLIFFHILYPSIVPMADNGNVILFADWTAIMKAVQCDNLGYDVYVANPCDPWSRKMVYGNILLYSFPFIEKFKLFYYAILPISINLIFIFIIVSFFKYENKFEYLIAALLVFNYPVLLAIERANFDILIFILFFLLSISNKFFINQIIVCLSSLIKFYPVASISVFLFDKKINKSIFNIVFSISIIGLILFLHKDSLIKIIDLKGQFTAYWIHSFGLKESLVILFQFINQQEFVQKIPLLYDSSYLSNIDKNDSIKYIYINLGLTNIYLYYIICFILFLLISIIFVKSYKRVKLISKYNFYKNFSMNYYEDRMFIVCSFIIIFCYLSFSNIVYREIFFIGLVPFLIKKIDNNENREYFGFFLNFILAKLFLSTVIIMAYTEQLFANYSVVLLLTKNMIDFSLIVIIAINISSIFYCFYIKKYLKIKN